ncbi:acyl carrier protein [Paenibacillus sp. JGP012]|uniref:phosphopantetheine-binding protein n=1 Tax=Paenibacillus sp. JGP012 TaxID=2735914 RepID=UPI001621F375|nr:phosphopantetheine-binding protein [Paenibacillus sp. JGP012]MBB6022775.1 acyl carrier protein [Paenibacillus sp. JGP012]
MKQDTEKKIIELLKRNITKRNFDDSTILDEDLNHLGINSLNFIKIIVELEEEFDITFSDQQMNFELFGKVKNLVALVNELLVTKKQ